MSMVQKLPAITQHMLTVMYSYTMPFADEAPLNNSRHFSYIDTHTADRMFVARNGRFWVEYEYIAVVPL